MVACAVRVSLPIALCVVLLSASNSSAQNAARMQSAAEAYDQGTSAYLSKNYATAARWFETADRLAPSEIALRQAVRSHSKAGNIERAGSVALKSKATYESDSKDVTRALRAAEKRFVRISVACDSCVLAVDGSALSFPQFFASAGETHEITATFETGSLSKSVTGQEGEEVEVQFDAPDPPPIPEADTAERGDNGRQPLQVEAPPKEPSGLSPAIFFVAAGLTAVAGGVLLGSGLDAKSGVPEYEQAAANARASNTPMNIAQAQQLLEAGQKKEQRTNILIGVTAGLAATTVVLGILTNWKGKKDSKEMAFGGGPTRDGFSVSLNGRF